MPMGTIRGAESTMGSDFDANNRTLGATANRDGTMRRDMEPHMQQPVRTDYDRPWVSQQERERQAQQQKEYLKQTSEVIVDFAGAANDQELPS